MQDIIGSYKQIKSRNFSKLHQMTAYLAMFPPNLPYVLIREYSKEGDVVYDPFSGRGTAVLEACRLGRVGIGNDLNPLAYVLTKAKSNVPHKEEIFKRIEELEKGYVPCNIAHIPSEIQMLFDKETTLPQLHYLKSVLHKGRKVDLFLLAVLTGILHGKMRKDGSSIYCSIDMPNTFSMSPNYIKRYIESHNLVPPKQNVFSLLRKRVEKLFTIENDKLEYQSLDKYVEGKAFCVDAIEASRKVVQRIGKERVKLIITSPPYLKVINYGKFNWIRLWLIDEDREQVDNDVTIYHKLQQQRLNDNMNLANYARYMGELFRSWNSVMQRDAYAFVVIGDVKIGSRTINLAYETWKRIEESGGCGLDLVDILEDRIESGEKQVKVTRIWGKKRGNATTVDRILVLQRK